MYNTIIIGAGPTGLALGYLLKKQGLPYYIIERDGQVASSWRGLWNNFTLATPMNEVDMFDLNQQHYLPNYRMTRDEAVVLLESFYKRHQLNC
jgi:putative flavoprotein involved in K+ transport